MPYSKYGRLATKLSKPEVLTSLQLSLLVILDPLIVL